MGGAGAGGELDLSGYPGEHPASATRAGGGALDGWSGAGGGGGHRRLAVRRKYDGGDHRLSRSPTPALNAGPAPTASPPKAAPLPLVTPPTATDELAALVIWPTTAGPVPLVVPYTP